MSSGSCNFPILSSVAPGSYYFTLTDNGSVVATSGNFMVTATTPTVTTVSITRIAPTSAVSGGTISSNGGATITTSGIVWGTTLNPTYVLGNTTNQTTDGPVSGTWSDNIGNSPSTPLTSNTLYHVRAYAVSSAGTGYGTDVQFTTTGGILTPPSPTCTITSPGTSSCNVALSWSVTNASTSAAPSAITSSVDNSGSSVNSSGVPYNTIGGFHVYDGNSGSDAPAPIIPYNSRTFFLYNSGVLLAQVTGTSTCGTTSDGIVLSLYGGVCQAPVNGGWSGWSDPAGLFRWCRRHVFVGLWRRNTISHLY